MRRFQFRFERLLEIRKYREREWELKLAEATGRIINLNNRIQDLDMERERVFKSRSFTGETNLAYIMTLSSLYMQRLGNTINDLSNELEEAELKAREIREGYLEASRARKTIDKLKENLAKIFYKEQEEAEMKSVDDINTASFIRNRKTSEYVSKDKTV